MMLSLLTNWRGDKMDGNIYRILVKCSEVGAHLFIVLFKNRIIIAVFEIRINI